MRPQKVPTRWVPSRGTPRVPAPLHLSPFSPPDRDRRVDSPAFSGRGSRPCPMSRAPSSSLPKALDANPSAVAGGNQSWPEPRAKHLCSPTISPISGISFSTRAHQKSSGVGALAPPCLPSPGSTVGSLVLALTQAPFGVFSLYGFQVHIRLFSSQCCSQEAHSLWWSHPPTSARQLFDPASTAGDHTERYRLDPSALRAP